MGRRRGPKFSFPIPGRRSHAKAEKNNHDDLTPVPSISSIPPAPEWSSRLDNSSNYSKAQRVLGTAGPPFRPPSRQASIPPSPGYMTVTVSEPGSDLDEKESPIAMDDGSLRPPRRPNMSNRASSNILPPNLMYTPDGRRGSNSSSISKHLHPRGSNSTMHSHYDAQSSPLCISQQTSNSAVRDMALRKGKPQISTYNEDHATSPLALEVSEGTKREHRKSKPPRLDLSKLFPKPKGHGGQEHAGALLSPNKMVNSPSAMSTVSDYFPRPMTREPTPTLRGHAKLTKPVKRHQAPQIQPQRSTSPTRLHKRDEYDNAKINVRRPPRGIQHWFEGLDEDSDELEEDDSTPVHAPRPVNPSGQILAPMRKSSLGRLLHDAPKAKSHVPHAPQHMPDPRKGHYLCPTSPAVTRLTSPSQLSLQSQSSLATTKTKESAFAKTNLQDSSVLSFSSSEDEEEHAAPMRRKVPVRDSIDMTDDHSDVVIGQAHALEVRTRAARRPSAGKLSMMSTSTNAATIEVMYTPEPYTPQHFPRTFNSSRRSSHMRQPSVIHEVEDARPQTAANRPMSPSLQSVRTSMSEPRTRGEGQKFMAVTAEEEALLEALRKKRAAMAQQSWTEGYVTAIKHEEVRQRTPPEQTNDGTYRTSAFLAIDTPSVSPVRVVETGKSRKPSGTTPSPLLLPPSRGRSVQAAQDASAGTSILRDSSSCDPESDRQPSPSAQRILAHQLSPPPEFSPLDPFPSPTPTASVASPTTLSHSPLPSPVTPGLRHGEVDVDVKVASSEPSCNGETDEVAVIETGVIEPPSGSIKPNEIHVARHQRRRTASSGADVPISFTPKPSPHVSRELAPVSEASSRPTSMVEPTAPQPKLPRKSSRRQSSLSVSTTGLSKSRHGSIVSNRTSSPVRTQCDRKSGRSASRVSSIGSMKRESVVMGTASTRCSVSEDVLAAWGNLGGLRDYDTARF